MIRRASVYLGAVFENLKDGRIIGQGSHAELIHTDSYYAQLVKKQADGLRLPSPMAA